MIINIVNLPVINTLFYFFRVCARCIDRGCTCNPEKTKKRTQEEWEELYTGPEFLVDFRYAQVSFTVKKLLKYTDPYSCLNLLFIFSRTAPPIFINLPELSSCLLDG